MFTALKTNLVKTQLQLMVRVSNICFAYSRHMHNHLHTLRVCFSDAHVLCCIVTAPYSIRCSRFVRSFFICLPAKKFLAKKGAKDPNPIFLKFNSPFTFFLQAATNIAKTISIAQAVYGKFTTALVLVQASVSLTLMSWILIHVRKSVSQEQ